MPGNRNYRTQEDLKLPTIDQQYEIIKELGSGLQSTVFLVKKTNQCFALKLFKEALPGYDVNATLEAIKAECQVLKQLHHPGIGNLEEFGYDPNRQQYYLVSEYIEGNNLYEATHEATFETVENLFIQALRALAYIHSRKIFHCDLKPENIRVQPSGVLEIIDFGLSGLKINNTFFGTPAYVAPELAFGFPPNSRSDLYSLAVTFYECILRINPFRSPTLTETLGLQQSLHPTELRKINIHIPEYFSTLIARLMAKNPSRRPGSAALTLKALNQLSGKQIPLETEATLQSYLPTDTELIGRKEILRSFENILDLVLQSKSTPQSSTLILWGENGSGKTRLLKELKFLTQLKGIFTQSLSKPALPLKEEPCVLFFDNATPDDLKNLHLLGLSFRFPHLIVATCHQAPEEIEAYKFELPPFTPDEIKQYLISLTGLSDPPLKLCQELQKRTHGNPLFITHLLQELITQKRLFDDMGRWSKDTFEDLGVEFENLSPPEQMKHYFDKLLTHLKPDELLILKLMAIHPSLVNLKDLRTLLPNSEPLLLNLLEKDLLERQGFTYNFTNPLLKTHLQSKLKDEARLLHQRWLKITAPTDPTTYLHHAGRIESNEASAKQLLLLAEHQLKESHLDNALQNIQLALSYKLQEVELQAKLLNLQGIIYEKLNLFTQALQTFDQIRSLLPKLKNLASNLPWRIELLEKIGVTYLRGEQLEKAKECFVAGLALLEDKNDFLTKQLLFKNYLGRVRIKEGNLQEAQNIFQTTQDVWKNLSQDNQAQVVNNDLGNVLLMQQNFSGGLQQFQSDLAFFKKIAHAQLIARTLYNLGETYFHLKDYENTIHHLKECVERSHEIKNYELLLRAYNGLGNVYNVKNDLQESLHYYSRALRIAEKTHEFQSQAAISTNMGNIQNQLNQLEEALVLLKGAINIIKSLSGRTAHEQYFEIRALVELADVYLKLERWEESRDCLRDALHLAENSEANRNQIFWIKLGQLKYSLIRQEADRVKELQHELTQSATEESQHKEIKALLENLSKPPEKKSIPAPVGHKKRELTRMETLTESEYQKLLSLIKLINSEHDLDFVLKSILHHALELSSAERGLILLLNESDQLEIKCWINMEVDPSLEQISTTIAQKAIDSGQTIKTDNAYDDERFNQYQSVLVLKLRSILCLPIYSRNRTIGVLYLDNKFRANVFGKVNQILLEAFCDQAGIAIENAHLFKKLQAATLQLEDKLKKTQDEVEHYQNLIQEGGAGPTRYSYKNIVSSTKAMHEIFQVMDKVTNTNLNVFIQGETGTGKELIAKALHYNHKSRVDKRFVAINCGAIPENLIESELFGHKAGAFTGAIKDKKGLFLEASGGTIFLDEIADLPLNLQVKLLRVLQENEITPLGGSQPLKIDARVLCASHKDLAQLVSLGKFREDLYYRLCQIKLTLPPLRERKEDIPLLVEKFVGNYGEQHKLKQFQKISSAFMKILMEHAWPGNIRELENIIHVSCALSDGKVLTPDCLPSHFQIRNQTDQTIDPTHYVESQKIKPMVEAPIDTHNPYDPNLAWQDYERLVFAKAYAHSNFNPQATAKSLDVSIATVYKKIKEFGLSNPHAAVFQEKFHYDTQKNLKDYLECIVKAAHLASGERPYTAIKWLKISQGHYYKVLKGLRE